MLFMVVFFFQAEDGIRDHCVTGVQTCSFFFSSRRRHTRSLCDWSSDVCSSHLKASSIPDRHHPPPAAYSGSSLAGNEEALNRGEHTSELQSHSDLVCRLLLEKKKKQKVHRRI